MDLQLSEKTALVTGSTAGIGLACARALAAEGARVVVNGRRQEHVDRALAALTAETPGARFLGVAADVSTAEGCEALAKAAPTVDILVNNAGIFVQRDFFDTTDAEWREFYELNVLAGVRLARAYLPGMQQRGWGRVLFVSSESARNIPPDMLNYGVTKTALLGLARGLAKRMAGTGVTVNAILPGPTLTSGMADMLAGQVQSSGKPLEEVAALFVSRNRPSSIIQRAARVEEVANLVAYVASPLSSATTGAALRVDGGVVDDIL